jgi:hypothetical protein
MSRRIDEHPINTTITGVAEHITYRLRQGLVDLRMIGLSPI